MSGFIAYPGAATWLYTQLTTPTQITGVLDAYEEDAPEGVTSKATKWIEFQALAPGDDVDVIGAQRVWTEVVFRVRAIARGRSTLAVAAIAKEIDNRLHRKDGTTSDTRVLSCVRVENGAEVPESWLEQGVEYRSLGQDFSLIVQPL